MRSLPLLGDRYRLGPVIGTGGMGAVHRAYDERFGREVAVKVVRSGADEVERERMRREAQYLAGLDHPSLVAVYDAGWDHSGIGETVWFAMELIEGPDLRCVLRDGGPMSTADVARVLEGAAGALATLHAAGVVHRDLKPANVLLTDHPASGRWDVKLADLGIAQLMRGDQLTSTGQVIGTAAYLSPEQVAGERIGPASDLYALGLLVLEALTGEIAFPGGAVESASARLVRSPEVPRWLGPAWRSLLTTMTGRHPGDRPTAEDVLRRCAALPRGADRAGTTLVMPATSTLLDAADTPTEAIGVVGTQVLERPVPPTTGWTPALRSRRRPLRTRRTLLAAGALTVAAALAGGGAAIVGGTAGATGAAQPAARTSPAPASKHEAIVRKKPSASPAPSHPAAPKKTASTATGSAAVAAKDSAASTTGAQHRTWSGLRQIQKRIEQRLRQRLAHHW